ncbi:PREDICTED: 60S ribosomal protein L7-like [Amphimedon queenslandica]|uniref:Large ribosomal subunit protein uL30 n=1 Tax=Amphimedon queenslandica TaxID=400682 RepID=A0A1X7UX89_AMPQE|nr:PREDICTED: 60S ribosomal protein L7-like [Amphimedon queenslandica]|eukprot:XP_003386433.1 PREDICTED: 60S ribosomal protein L7-like [Amphimedon queenslandica]
MADTGVAEGGKLPRVPETLLKKRKRLQEIKEAAAKRGRERSKARRLQRKDIFKRAEKYVLEYRQREKEAIRLKREAKTAKNYYIPPEHKLAIVVRIKGINGLSPRVRKILQIMRLRQINNAVFIRLNKASLNMLRLVEPYVAWGYPSLRTIRYLVYKRGYGKLSQRRRVPLLSNAIIQKALLKDNIICMEDIVHEIFTVGPKFKEVNNFLWPFKLTNPKGGWRKKTTHFIEGGDHGNREELINKLVQKMI